MKIQTLLVDEMGELRHRDLDVHALLEKIFQHKDGKGDYAVERHKWMETLDKETFLNEIRRIEQIRKQNEK